MPLDPASIPAELRTLPQWVCWKSETKPGSTKPTKIPLNVRGGLASTTDRSTWCDFETALNHAATHEGLGVGFVFHHDDPYCGIDLDNCFLDEQPSAAAYAIIKAFATYTEISPSGSGVKMFLKGKKPPNSKCGIEHEWEGNPGGIECYDNARFFTVTGDCLPGSPVICADAQELLDRFCAKFLPGSSYAASPPPLIDGDSPPDAPPEQLAACKLYLQTCPDSISGKRGHNRALRAACECFRFGLSHRQAVDFMRWWSENKSGVEPWTEKEILHKVTSAWQKVRQQGELNIRLKQEPPLRLDDIDNGKRLIRRHGEEVRWSPSRDLWMIWDGMRWKYDEAGEILALAKGTARSIFVEAARAADPDYAAKVAKHAIDTSKIGRLKAMAELARSESGVAVEAGDLDADPMLLNVKNGTIDLRTGTLMEHDPDRLITKLAPVVFDPEAICPLFLAFLDRIMAGNHNLISFLQRAIGYSITGEVGERKLFLNYGGGANGKSTLLEIVSEMLGDYAMAAPPNAFVTSHHDNGAVHEIASMHGARMITATEINEGRNLDESLVKRITGNEKISGRHLYGNFFSYRPQFKVWLATNHKPGVKGTDDAIWDRLPLIPFNVTIPEPERDIGLLGKLLGELPGILNWTVEGCLRWQQDGLAMPTEVRQATAEYRAESDTVQMFIDECCNVAPGLSVGAKDLYAAYLTNCDATGEKALSHTAFGTRLTNKEHVADEHPVTRKTIRLGLALRTPVSEHGLHLSG